MSKPARLLVAQGVAFGLTLAFIVIPASENTRGHGTTQDASLWKNELEALLWSAPMRHPD